MRIFSLHQKKFSEYVIVNPIIRSFQHGEHQAGSNDTMQHTMTLEYETVLYYYGTTSKNTVPGFLELHYDLHPSPLTPAGGGTASILGQGGLLQTADEITHDLANGDYGSALFKGMQGLRNASSMDLKSAAIGAGIGATAELALPALSRYFSKFPDAVDPATGSLRPATLRSGRCSRPSNCTWTPGRSPCSR